MPTVRLSATPSLERPGGAGFRCHSQAEAKRWPMRPSHDQSYFSAVSKFLAFTLHANRDDESQEAGCYAHTFVRVYQLNLFCDHHPRPSDLGQAVRAGIWGVNFYYYLAATLLPFPLFLLLALWLHGDSMNGSLLARKCKKKVQPYAEKSPKL